MHEQICVLTMIYRTDSEYNETICSTRHGVVLVKIDDPAYAASHGIDATPKLVYFENEVPNIFAGDLSNEDEVRYFYICYDCFMSMSPGFPGWTSYECHRGHRVPFVRDPSSCPFSLTCIRRTCT